MALTVQQLDAVWRRFIANGAGVNLTNPARWSVTDLQAAATAADTWLTNNLVSFSASFTVSAPQFGSNSTPVQQAALLLYVVMAKAGLL